MGNQANELFRMALGLAEPSTVEKIEFSDRQHQIDLYLDSPPAATFPAPPATN